MSAATKARMMTERIIRIMARGWPGRNPVFQTGLVRLPLVRGLLHGINTGMCHKRDLTDQQWKILDPQVPEPARRRDGRVGPGRSGGQF